MFAALLIAVAAMALSPTVVGLEDSSSLAGVAGIVITLVWTGVELLDRWRVADQSLPTAAEVADQLAGVVETEWREEARVRRLRDPKVLPLLWTTRAEFSDAPAAILGRGTGRVTRLTLDGRLDEEFENAINLLADGLGRLPSRRLVILGEPGAGKTVLALLLTLGLLRGRTPGTTVPVLLSVASWDPVIEALDDWVVRALATSYYGGRTTVPQRLLDEDLLLPVLDGLDEIPESARRNAVGAINYATRQGRPVVVTCRSAEYEDIVRGGAPVLRRAPVVEVEPVATADAIAYLSAIDWPPDTTWDRVYDHLRQDPPTADSPVAMALSTPLMISLAALVYQRVGGDPGELLDPVRFDSRHKVEDHITDQMIDAAYAPERLPSGHPVVGSEPRWSAARARNWLTILARDMHRRRDRDIAWWLVGQRLLSSWVAPSLGLGGGLLLLTAVAAWVTVFDRQPVAEETVGQAGRLYWILVIGGGVGAGFAVAAMIIWYAAAGRPPGRVTIAIRGTYRRLRRGFVTGLAVAGLPVTAVLLVAAAVVTINYQWSIQNIDGYARAVVGSVFASAIVGLAIAAHNWLDAPPERATQADPITSIRQDRRSSLVGALSAALVMAAGGLAVTVAGMAIGSLTVQALTDWAGWPGEPNAWQTVKGQWHATVRTIPSTRPVVIGAAVVLPSTIIGLLLLLSRAWPRYLVARAILAAQRRLPLALPTFLEDARTRGVLRLTSGVYQFRHVRLQERLAGRIDTDARAQFGPPARRHLSLRPARIAASVLVLAAMLAVGAVVLPEDDADESIAGEYLTGHSAQFNSDGTWMAISGFADKTIRIKQLHAERGGPTDFRLPKGSRGVLPNGLFISPDNETIAAVDVATNLSSDSRFVWLWRWDGSGFQPIEGWNQQVSTLLDVRQAVRFLGGGNVLALASLSESSRLTTRLWDIRDPAFIRPIELPQGAGTPQFSPDGNLVAVREVDNKMRLLDLVPSTDDGPPIRELPIAEEVSNIRFIATAGPGHRPQEDPRWMITVGSDEVLHLRNRSGELVQPLGATTAAYNLEGSVAFDDTGKWVAVLGDDGRTQIWNLGSPRDAPRLVDGAENGSMIRIDTTGRILAIAGEKSVQIFGTEALSPLAPTLSMDGAVEDIELNPGGTVLTTTVDAGIRGQTHRRWTIGKQLREWPEAVRVIATSSARMFTSGGCRLVVGGYDGTLTIWDIGTRESTKYFGHGGAVTSIQASPADSRRLVTTADDGTVRLWNLPSEACA